MSPNAGYWEKELKEATDSRKKLEQEQDEMNPLVGARGIPSPQYPFGSM